MKEFTSIDNNYKILMGTNAKENDILVKAADQNDLWFHLCEGSSPHLVIFNGGDHVSKDELKQCGELVKLHSKARNCHRVHVGFVERRYIKRTKTPGQVIVKKDPKCIVI